MIRILSFLSFLLFALPVSVYAQKDIKFDAKVPNELSNELSKADFSELKHTKSGRIDKVIDGLTLLLKDGTIVRLASINIPDFHIWERAAYSDNALKLLQEKLPERTEVMLYQTRNPKKGRTNRMGHELAHLVIKKDNIWIQGLFLANGLAQVYTAPNSSDMLQQMYQTEAQARQEKRGLWGEESEFPILSPEQTTQKIGDFVIVEGTVKKVAAIRNNIYLNFGQDWKTDFTIMITPALRKKFARQSINPLGLSGQKIRARGFLRSYNGPLIELEDTAHLEILQNTSENPNVPNNSDTQ